MATDIAPIHDADRTWRIGFGCQWGELLSRGMNWKNFDLIAFQLEWGSYKGRYVEAHIALLGLVCDIEWMDRLTRASFMAELDQAKVEAGDWFDTEEARDAE